MVLLVLVVVVVGFFIIVIGPLTTSSLSKVSSNFSPVYRLSLVTATVASISTSRETKMRQNAKLRCVLKWLGILDTLCLLLARLLPYAATHKQKIRIALTTSLFSSFSSLFDAFSVQGTVHRTLLTAADDWVVARGNANCQSKQLLGVAEEGSCQHWHTASSSFFSTFN